MLLRFGPYCVLNVGPELFQFLQNEIKNVVSVNHISLAFRKECTSNLQRPETADERLDKVKYSREEGTPPDYSEKVYYVVEQLI